MVAAQITLEEQLALEQHFERHLAWDCNILGVKYTSYGFIFGVELLVMQDVENVGLIQYCLHHDESWPTSSGTDESPQVVFR